VTRRVVTVRLAGRSAHLTGRGAVAAVRATGCRWQWALHDHRGVMVPANALADVLDRLELDGIPVEIFGREGERLAHGGLLGGPA
jgi:hypothetical protein